MSTERKAMARIPKAWIPALLQPAHSMATIPTLLHPAHSMARVPTPLQPAHGMARVPTLLQPATVWLGFPHRCSCIQYG